MTKRNEHEEIDDLAPELRKALLESGAVIPTTPAEVALVERHLKITIKPGQVETAFRKLKKVLDNPADDLGFIKPTPSFSANDTQRLAMAARHGTELDADTRAKIEETVKRVLQKPPQNSSK